MPLEDSCMSCSLWCGLGLKEGFVPGSYRVGGGWVFPESCRSSMVFCVSCVGLIGLLD